MIKKSDSPAETRRIAAGLAKKIVRHKNRSASIVALKGELGSGKTVFVRGFLRGVGVTKPVRSPTFVLMKRYALPNIGRVVFHVDAYRMRSPSELTALDFGSIIKNPENILLVEWPERTGKTLPKKKMFIRFAYGKKKNERLISL